MDLRTKISFFLLLPLLSLFVGSCGNDTGKPDEKQPETTTSGTISIAVDESIQPIVAQQLEVYDSSFPKVHINEQYLTESSCFRLLLQDSVRMILVTRDLTPEEKSNFEAHEVPTRSLAIARDAVALIVHPGSPDSLMTLGQLKQILLGKFSRSYNIVFDNPQSGIVRYVLDSLIPGQELPSNAYAVSDNEAVIDYVAKNKNALGIVGLSHIYDPNDQSGVGTFKKDVRVVALRNDSSGAFFQPYQAYIALGDYPLTRPIYFISRETWQGPATGFANFLSGERGQLIFNKARLVPLRVQLTIREAEIKP